MNLLLVHFILLRSDYILSSFIIRKYNRIYLVIIISKLILENITNSNVSFINFSNNLTNFFELSIIRFKIHSSAFRITRYDLS